MTARRVLVVDDDPDIRANLADVLTDMGYAVDTAGDATSGLRLAAQRRYDVALLDLKLPGADGIELYRRIRETRSGTVAILITAYASSEAEASAISAGAWNVLPKPLDLSKLLPMLEEVVRRPLVIVVDDDRELTRSLWDVLREKRYRVCTAHNVDEADTLLRENRYDLALIDMKLPSGDGRAVQERLKATSPNAECIIITGHGQDMSAAIAESLRGGATDVCYKPFNMPELIGKLERLLGKA